MDILVLMLPEHWVNPIPMELDIPLQTYNVSNFLVASAYVFILTFT